MNIQKLRKLNKLYSVALSNLDKLKLIFIGIIYGVIEMFSLSLIVNFSKDIIDKKGIILFGKYIYDLNLIVAFIIAILILKFLINISAIKIQVNIIFNAIGTLSVDMLNSYFQGPIEDVFGERQGRATRNIFNEPIFLALGIYLPSSIIISELIITISLLSQLFFINYLFAIPIVLMAILIYLCLWIPFLSKLSKYGDNRMEAEGERLRLAIQTINIIPDIVTQGLKDIYLDLYKTKTKLSTDSQSQFNLYKSSPKAAIELIVVSAFLISFLFIRSLGLLSNFALFESGALLFVLYRLLPASTRIASSLGTVKYNLPVAKTILKRYKNIKNNKIEFRRPMILENIIQINWGAVTDTNMPFFIENMKIIKGINLIKGASGSGKTSLLLGLANLNKNLKIKNKINKHIYSRSKEQNISYTSQDTILTGKNIEEAILAGRNRDQKKIDIFIDFIQLNFKDLKLSSAVINLSGGQKKLIAFLRSLYSDKKYYLFDEIFSGVDKKTANNCIKFIKTNYNDRFIIIIDHNTLDSNQVDNSIFI